MVVRLVKCLRCAGAASAEDTPIASAPLGLALSALATSSARLCQTPSSLGAQRYRRRQGSARGRPIRCGCLRLVRRLLHFRRFDRNRPQPTAPGITLVRDGCGLGFHWAPCGCIRNYTACPVVVAPVAPVVVAPQYAPPVVVTPAVCPYGYYLGPYGRCLPY